MRNVLHVNPGIESDSTLQFSEVAMSAGIEATDWSWTPLVADFDLDGYRDIIITNGFPKDVTDRDFIDYHASNYAFVDQEKLLARIPEVKIPNYAYKNVGDARFKDVSGDWGLNIPSFSNGAAYADLDNDGDLDFVVNNIDDPAFVFRNNGEGNYIKVVLKGEAPNVDATGAIIEYTTQSGLRSVYEHSRHRGYLSTIGEDILIGLGVDSVVYLTVYWHNGGVTKLDGVQSGQTVELTYEKEGVDASRVEAQVLFAPADNVPEVQMPDNEYIDYNHEPLILHKLSQYGPGIAVGDVNGDGRDDYYLTGGSEHEGRLILQDEDGTFRDAGAIHDESYKEGMGALFFDADGDGDQDLYICSGSNEAAEGNRMYEDILLINQNGSFEAATDALDIPAISSSCVRAADYDQDGDLDLFVGARSRPGRYPLPATSYLLTNHSEGGSVAFTIADHATLFEEVGLVTDAIWTDFDDDGWVDLIVTGEWMPVRFYRNDRGKFADVTSQTGVGQHTGWWNSIAPGDFDGDGDQDYVVGNYGTNSTLRASSDMPARVYIGDFDQNGAIDPIPTLFLKDTAGTYREYAYHGRGDLFKQLVRVKGDFNTHHDMGLATIESILSDEERREASVAEATTFESSYLENLGEGKFALHHLPIEAQWAPVYGMVTSDMDGDGNLDVLIAGNDYGMEVRTGRMDAMSGLVLLGNGDGSFHAVRQVEAGFCVPGDAKGLAMVQSGVQKIAVGTQNNDVTKAYVRNVVYPSMLAEWDDRKVEFLGADGAAIRVLELHYGCGFLSQSTRSFDIPTGTETIRITKYTGDQREVEHFDAVRVQ